MHVYRQRQKQGGSGENDAAAVVGDAAAASRPVTDARPEAAVSLSSCCCCLWGSVVDASNQALPAPVCSQTSNAPAMSRPLWCFAAGRGCSCGVCSGSSELACCSSSLPASSAHSRSSDSSPASAGKGWGGILSSGLDGVFAAAVFGCVRRRRVRRVATQCLCESWDKLRRTWQQTENLCVAAGVAKGVVLFKQRCVGEVENAKKIGVGI